MVTGDLRYRSSQKGWPQQKFLSTRVIYCFLCYHVNWSYGGSIIVYHSLVYDFKVGPAIIYVLATPRLCESTQLCSMNVLYNLVHCHITA